MRIMDMHCDTISELLKRKREGKEHNLRENDGHIDLLRMQNSNYLLQNFALFVNLKSQEDPWLEVLNLIKFYEDEMNENSHLIAPVKCFEDISLNEQQNKMSSVLTVEEGAVCQGDLAKLNMLYDKGVRMLTLTWNYPNELGYPNLDNKIGKKAWAQNSELKNSRLNPSLFAMKQKQVDEILKTYLNTPDTINGLTTMGIEFVREMEQLGMIIDVSHLSDAGFYDVLNYTKKPFVASHSNARTVCPCVRNMTDHMIRCLAQRGGVVGLNFCADFLTQKAAGQNNPGTIADIVTHAKHIVNVGGIECIGLGSDFDGIDTNQELPGAQAMKGLWDGLKRGGFTESQLDCIFWKNVYHLYSCIL